MGVKHRVEEVDGVLVVYLAGYLDAHSSPVLELSLKKISEDLGPAHMILDFAEVDYMSSAGLRLLHVLTRWIKNSGFTLSITSLQDSVETVVDISGFNAILNVYPGVEEALASVKAK